MRRVTHSHGLTPFRTPPSRQPRVAAATRRRRPVLQPALVSIQVPGFHRPLARQVPPLPLAHLLIDCAAAGTGRTRCRGAPGHAGGAGTGQDGAAEWGCRIRSAGELPRSTRAGLRAERVLLTWPAAPAPLRVRRGTRAPLGECSRPAAHPARLLNESPAGPGSCAAPPPASRPLAPPPTSEPPLAAPCPLPPSQQRAHDSPARPRCSTPPPLEPPRDGRGCARRTDRDQDAFRMRPFVGEGCWGGGTKPRNSGLCNEAKKCSRLECYSGTVSISCVTRTTAANSWEFSYLWNWLSMRTTSVSWMRLRLTSRIPHLVSKRVCKKCSPRELLCNLPQIPPPPECPWRPGVKV